MKTKISIGSDHAGFALKTELIPLLKELDCEVADCGCFSAEQVDYPDYAALVARDVQAEKSRYGILICGTGIGMAITANKHKGIRAASLTDEYSLLMARKHNNLNVLCLGARVIGSGTARLLVETFLQTEFEGSREDACCALRERRRRRAREAREAPLAHRRTYRFERASRMALPYANPGHPARTPADGRARGRSPCDIRCERPLSPRHQPQ